MTAPAVDQLDHLDWTPACAGARCQVGHPPATHHTVSTGELCWCGGIPLCTDCADRISSSWAHAVLPMTIRCARCDRTATITRPPVEVRPL